MVCLLYHSKYFWGQFPATPEEVSTHRGCSVTPVQVVPWAEKTELPGAALPMGRAAPFPWWCPLLADSRSRSRSRRRAELPGAAGSAATPAASPPHSGRAGAGSQHSPCTSVSVLLHPRANVLCGPPPLSGRAYLSSSSDKGLFAKHNKKF